MAEKDFADAREMVEADLDALEVRGPLHFDFGPDKLGEFEALDMQTAEGRVVEAQGPSTYRPSPDSSAGTSTTRRWISSAATRGVASTPARHRGQRRILAALAEDEKATQI